MADEQPLGSRDRACEVVCGFRRAIPDLIVQARIPDLRNDGGGNVLEALEPMKRVSGLDGDGAAGRVVLLLPPRAPGEEACGPKSGDELRDAPGGVRWHRGGGTFDT